jgi:hypothetical protein
MEKEIKEVYMLVYTVILKNGEKIVYSDNQVDTFDEYTHKNWLRLKDIHYQGQTYEIFNICDDSIAIYCIQKT